MAKFTLLEIHLEDASFSADAPFRKVGSTEGTDEAETDGEDEETDERAAGSDDSGGPGKLVAAVVGFLFILALAVLAKKLLGDKPDVGEVTAEEVETES